MIGYTDTNDVLEITLGNLHISRWGDEDPVSNNGFGTGSVIVRNE